MLRKDKTLNEISDAMQQNWKVFPEVETLAYYSFFGQHIALKKVSMEDWKAFLDGHQITHLKVEPVLFHEFAHYLDHVATLWGQSLLVNTFDAMNVRLTAGAEGYWKAVELMRDINRIQYSEYYSEYTEDDIIYEKWNGMPWKWELSCGMQFEPSGRLSNNRPIPFTRFFTSERQYLCRVPFSVASLLEITATAVQMDCLLFVIGGMPETDQKREITAFRGKTIEKIYDPTYALYSVAGHYLANKMDVKDVVYAYRLASAIARLCLNMPTEYIESLRIPEEYKDWGTRNKMLNRLKDRGYLFICLVANGANVALPDSADDSNWLDEILKASELPSLEKVYAQTRKEMAVLESISKLVSGPANG